MSQVTSNIRLNVDSSQVEVAKRVTGLLADETERAAAAAERWSRAVSQGASAMVTATSSGGGYGGQKPAITHAGRMAQFRGRQGGGRVGGGVPVVQPIQPPQPPEPQPPPTNQPQQQQPWFKRGFAGEVHSTMKVGMGVAMGEGLIGMFRTAIQEAYEYQEILSKIGSTLGNAPQLYARTKSEMNKFASDYSFFQEEALAIANPLLATQGNLSGINAVGDVSRTTGLNAPRIAPLIGRMRFLTRGGAPQAARQHMSSLMAPAFSVFGNDQAGMRGPQVDTTLQMINAAQTQGYMLSADEQKNMSSMMGAAAGISPAFAGQGGTNLMMGLQRGLQAPQGGIGAAMLVRAGMRVGNIEIEDQDYDLSNIYHLRRFKEAGLLRSPQGMKVVQEYFKMARENYENEDVAKDVLQRSLGISFSQVDKLWGAGDVFTQDQYDRDMSADPQVSRRLAAYKKGPGAQRGVTVGKQVTLRETGDVARQLQNEFIDMVSAVANASGGLEKFGTLIEKLYESDSMRRFLEASNFLMNPTAGTAAGIAALELSISGLKAAADEAEESFRRLNEEIGPEKTVSENYRGIKGRIF
jgi:hypothetical protein